MGFQVVSVLEMEEADVGHVMTAIILYSIVFSHLTRVRILILQDSHFKIKKDS